MRNIKVLYLPHPVREVEQKHSLLREKLGEKFNLRIFDENADPKPQFEDIEVAVDFGGNINAELVPVAAQAGLKYIQAQTNGLDHIEVEKILDAGIKLAHCPGDLSSVSLAEGAMMFILMLAHRYEFATAQFYEGQIYSSGGMELAGRSLGILGFGAAGQQLARRAKAFEMRVHGIDIRNIEKEILDEIKPDFLGGPEDLDDMVSNCDFISVHLHLNKDTRHIINKRLIDLMKPTAYMINVSRGGLIDEEALYEALSQNRIAGAGLDAFAQEPPDHTLPVYKLPNVLVQPHTVASTDGLATKRSNFAIDNLTRYAEGKSLEGLISERI